MHSSFFQHICLFAGLLLLGQGQAAAAVCADFSETIVNGSYGIAETDGTRIRGCNLDDPLVPASLAKIPTVLAALALLGDGYRFPTEIFRDEKDNLYIKGFGDPLLISEEVRRIAAVLRAQGLAKVGDIVIDDSAYALEAEVPGSENSANPYDAPVGPVTVNFNAVPFVIDKGGAIQSAEPQTPTLSLMKVLAAKQQPGRYRVNICTSGCQPRERVARYAGELFAAILPTEGVAVEGGPRLGTVPGGLAPLLVHRGSKTLLEVCASMLASSNNVMANQVFLASGSRRFGPPATWGKARRAVAEVMADLLGREVAAGLHQVDGSGLSRENRMSARALLASLQAFSPHAALLPKRRAALLKSGTMRGIHNYAGYFADGRPFVILLNQQANTRDTVLDSLRSGLH